MAGTLLVLLGAVRLAIGIMGGLAYLSDVQGGLRLALTVTLLGAFLLLSLLQATGGITVLRHRGRRLAIGATAVLLASGLVGLGLSVAAGFRDAVGLTGAGALFAADVAALALLLRPGR
jgi:hypothetical protein